MYINKLRNKRLLGMRGVYRSLINSARRACGARVAYLFTNQKRLIDVWCDLELDSGFPDEREIRFVPSVKL